MEIAIVETGSIVIETCFSRMLNAADINDSKKNGEP